MKQILYVGEFGGIFPDNNFGTDIYDAQICVGRAAMVKVMLKIKNPELVVISLMGIGADAEEILRELRCNYGAIPVICIGTDEEINAHADNISTPQFSKIIYPTDRVAVFDMIQKLLAGENLAKGLKKCILLVDDSNIQLRTLNELLKQKYEVRMAISGKQALSVIEKKKPDMIFLDYEMPEWDGKKTFEMLKEMDEAKDIPVVFLTGVSDKKHIESVLALQPAGYLLKPAKADSIYKIIEKIIG